MSIKFKIITKAQPGVAGGGIKKFYAQIVNGEEMTIDELVKDIEKFSSLSEPDIKGVIVALENVIQDALASSRIVRLEKLGSFYPTLSSDGATTQDDADSSLIRDIGVNYRPGKRILDSMKGAGFHKVD